MHAVHIVAAGCEPARNPEGGLSRGMSWGEDIILSSSELRVKNSARAIGFLEVQQLSREKLQ